MLVVMPLLLLVIFGYAANFYVSTASDASSGPAAAQTATILPSIFDVTVTRTIRTQADAGALLRDNQADVRHRHRETPLLRPRSGSDLYAAVRRRRAQQGRQRPQINAGALQPA